MKILHSILFTFGLFILSAQNPIQVFDNLVESTWISEGQQLGGFVGKTEYEFSTGLNGSIIYVKTFTTDPKTKEFGLRNEGVRAFNANSKQLEFYEFDKLGGITKGVLIVEEKNMHYEYEYQGMILRDSWIFKSKNEYQYIVGTWSDGKWTKKFHEATIKRR